MSFHEILFPLPLARGVTFGPMRKTDIQTRQNGAEIRNSAFYNSRRRYEFSTSGLSVANLSLLANFFEARMGQLYGFRFRDGLDNKSCAPNAIPSFSDCQIGVGDGVNKVFQLSKTYGDTAGSYKRAIKKPVSGSVLIGKAGSLVANNLYTVDFTTGLVTFITAPANGTLISAGFSFDVPVRFDNEMLELSLDGFSSGRGNNIILLEILL